MGMKCQVELGFEYESILCGKPAVILIDRRDSGRLRVCKECLDNPELWKSVLTHGFVWRPLETDRVVQRA